MPDRFHLLGAYDRFNYGDILFAHIGEEQVKARFPGAAITHYAALGSDLTAEGGVVTQPLKAVVQNIRNQPEDRHIILVTGGEVLSTPWSLITEHSVPRLVARQMQRGRKYLGEEAMNAFCKRLGGTPWDLPWLPDPESMPPARNVHVLYNSVGGIMAGKTGETAANWQRRALSKADFLSVRDSRSADSVESLGIARPRVSPDSAVTMASLTLASALPKHRQAVAARMAAGRYPEGGYVCLQCGENYFRGQEELLASQARAVHDATGLPIVLFAIGRASGHSDHLVARRLQDLLGAPAWLNRAPEDMTVAEIMALVAGSALYIGTSLHGFITAFSFGVPRVGLDPRVPKITSFRDAWDLADAPAGTPFAEIAAAANRALSLEPAQMAARSEAAVARYRADTADMWASVGG